MHTTVIRIFIHFVQSRTINVQGRASFSNSLSPSDELIAKPNPVIDYHFYKNCIENTLTHSTSWMPCLKSPRLMTFVRRKHSKPLFVYFRLVITLFVITYIHSYDRVSSCASCVLFTVLQYDLTYPELFNSY